MTMTVFSIVGDLAVVGTGFVRTTRGERAAQAFQNRVDLLQGTYDLAKEEGARWIDILHAKHGENLIGAELIRLALQDPEITRAVVIEQTFDPHTRKGSAKVRCWFYDTSEDLDVQLFT
jgi:hypothetical protein